MTAIVAACSHPVTRPAGTIAPVMATHGAQAVDIDALEFLRGCWSWREFDWGFAVCWQRVGDVWLGSLDSYGAEPKWHVDFTIARGVRELEWTASTTDPHTWFAGQRVDQLTASGPGVVVFGEGVAPIDRFFAADPVIGELVFRPNARMHELLLQRRKDLDADFAASLSRRQRP